MTMQVSLKICSGVAGEYQRDMDQHVRDDCRFQTVLPIQISRDNAERGVRNDHKENYGSRNLADQKHGKRKMCKRKNERRQQDCHNEGDARRSALSLLKYTPSDPDQKSHEPPSQQQLFCYATVKQPRWERKKCLEFTNAFA